MPFKAKNNREAVVVCAIYVVKRPSKRSVLVQYNLVSRTPGDRRNLFVLSGIRINRVTNESILYVYIYTLVAFNSMN